ncbi:cytochrome c-type biogenesis protein CcmH [Pacificibacter maritimus]|uniref:Cytochrome c-type biogenesis protein n=1 Tax=Pacificibacter maritimus TaxID=762213 RepID=A0A3N4UKJ7_9RHOB|nr:cytochrome c-type biogenesis protein [Pacificibacter maritimus]RPE71186.1 cytochrome c-type biogenesis protein CcmH [Pacificibacter maritimus]
MRYFGLILAFICALPAYAVQPSEVLNDPVLEGRAREISKDLRCLVCRNENIDESNALLAQDLRILVRERLVAGDTDAEVIDFVVARYGEYVLLNPTVLGANRLLWIAGPVMLFTALGLVAVFIRRRQTEDALDELSDQEIKRLEKILKQ